MMRPNTRRRNFNVVQFIELPFEGIDDYVCVPHSWVITLRRSDQKAVVAYPKDEDPFVTRDRAKRKERYDDDWRFYMAVMKYESDIYTDAEFWIATRNDYGPLVEEELRVDIQPQPLRSANRNCLSKSKKDKPKRRLAIHDNPRKPLPKILIRRPGLANKHQKLKLDEAAQRTSTSNTNMEPGCSNSERSVIFRDKLPMASVQIGTAGTSKSTEQSTQSQRTDQDKVPQHPSNNESTSRHSGQVTTHGPTEVIVIDAETKDNNLSHLPGTQATSIAAPNPSTSAERIPQAYQYDDRRNTLEFPPEEASIRSTNNIDSDERPRADDISNYKSSHHGLHSQKIKAQIYRHMDTAQRLVPFSVVERQIRFEKIDRDTAIPSQNPSKKMRQSRSSSTRSMETQATSTQNQSQDISRYTRAPKMHGRNSNDSATCIAMNSQEIQHVPRVNVGRSHNMTAIDPKSVGSVKSISQTPSSLPHQRPSFVHRIDRQNLPTQGEYLPTMHVQDTPQISNGSQNISLNARYQELLPYEELVMHQPHQLKQCPPRSNSDMVLPQGRQSDQTDRPKLRVRISLKPKNRQKPQEVTKKNLSKVLDSIKKSLITTLHQQRTQTNSSGISTEQSNTATPRNTTATTSPAMMHSLEMPSCSFHQSTHTSLNENVYQNRAQKRLGDECTETNLRIKRFKDDLLKLPPSERLVDSACEINESIAEELLCSDSSDTKNDVMSEQVATVTLQTNNADYANHQRPPRVVLEQQMLDQFATLYTQMGTTLKNTADMYKNLRSSILETADAYKKILGAVERFNASGNLASTSSNGTPEEQMTEERRTGGTQSENSSNGNSNVPRKKHNNLWRFVLPKEYDPHDSRWTLKYRENMPGLVELVPESRIYVSYGELKYCEQLPKDCESLAEELLLEIFSKNALSVCLSLTEQMQASNTVGPNVRPTLNEQACTVLINFVLEHGTRRGWDTNRQAILSSIHEKIQEMRFRYGVMARVDT